MDVRRFPTEAGCRVGKYLRRGSDKLCFTSGKVLSLVTFFAPSKESNSPEAKRSSTAKLVNALQQRSWSSFSTTQKGKQFNSQAGQTFNNAVGRVAHHLNNVRSKSRTRILPSS